MSNFGGATFFFRGTDFTGKQVGSIYSQDHIHTLGGDAPGMVVVSDGFDDGVRQAPHTQQVGSNLRARNVNQFFFDLEEKYAFLLRLRERACEMHGRTFGDDRFADIVHQGSEHDRRG
jgi:hypothetical protein